MFVESSSYAEVATMSQFNSIQKLTNINIFVLNQIRGMHFKNVFLLINN